MENLKILKHLLKNEDFPCNIGDVDETLNILNMSKNIQKVKSMHNYPINYTEKSGWFTFVDDITQPSGKKLIRKASEEKLWGALIEWYLDNTDRNINLKDLYPIWLDRKRTPGNGQNIRRIEKAWSAYYLNEPLSKEILEKPMVKVTSFELRTWAESLLKKHYPADKKKFSRIFTIVNQCFDYACDEDVTIIPDNTWRRARKKINKSLIVSKPTAEDDTQVFTDAERIQIKQAVYEDLERYSNKPTSAGLEILFLFETGLRMGEVTGLKWSDIKDNRLYIRRQADNSGIKEKTKSNAGYRDIPLTKEAQRILEDVRRFNQTHGCHAEWIFQSDNPAYGYRLSYNAADRKLRKLCNRLNIVVKSPHKIRKTCISTLLDNPGVNNRTVQRFAGHSDLSVTMQFYNFERRSKEEQAEAIDKALSLAE